MAAAKISGVLMITFPTLVSDLEPPTKAERQLAQDFVAERRDEKGRRTHQPSSCGLSRKIETFSERALLPAPVMMIPEFHWQVESRRSVPRRNMRNCYANATPPVFHSRCVPTSLEA